ncbi:uncharacterized protein LOC132037551 isoform X2 [Lycium ferocissimum]|uniref:uncharacterized protein LOC132037551 isoform X2 n=1 Tax=Lycium ferocissimum TaxID=112874 RepID=UPI0028156020|nr:uncharacterized protein LOC132037551 isoform X2 [Lycium ferocissimum]
MQRRPVLIAAMIERNYGIIANIFTKIIKEKLGETSTSKNEDSFEVYDGAIERNITTNENEEGENQMTKCLKLLMLALCVYRQTPKRVYYKNKGVGCETKE